MKKLASVLLAAIMLFSLAACQDAGSGSGGGEEAFKGKIAIITNTVSQNEEEFRSAEQFQKKYGADKVIHQTWPDNFSTEQEQMVTTVSKLAADPEVRALIINQAVPGTNNAVDRLLETRDDIFIVYAEPQDNPVDVAARANLVIMPDNLKMGPLMIEQAASQGAKVFVHYSFPRHMSQILLSGRRDLMAEKCAELGIEFVDATAPDPTGEMGLTGAQQFILEDVPKMVEKYGKDTAFFSTNCSMQIPLIKSVVEEGAIYPQPCCPSPFHGFPAALGLKATDVANVQATIDETNKVISEYGMEGRCSTWPVPAAMMVTVASAEYAVKWINGEVAKDGIDMKVLNQCMKDYAGVEIEMSTYVENGVEYPNFLLTIMDYLTYNGVEG